MARFADLAGIDMVWVMALDGGDSIEVELSSSTLAYRGETFAFPALGSVPQSLYLAGGVEGWIRSKLGTA